MIDGQFYCNNHAVGRLLSGMLDEAGPVANRGLRGGAGGGDEYPEGPADPHFVTLVESLVGGVGVIRDIALSLKPATDEQVDTVINVFGFLTGPSIEKGDDPDAFGDRLQEAVAFAKVWHGFEGVVLECIETRSEADMIPEYIREFSRSLYRGWLYKVH